MAKDERCAASVWMSTSTPVISAISLPDLRRDAPPPRRRICQHVDDGGDQLRGARGEIAVGDVKRIGLADIARIGEHAAAAAHLADGEIRIPHRPGVDTVAGEGGGAVRRAQINRRDVGVLQAGFFQRQHHDIVGARAFGEADAFAFEVAQACGCAPSGLTRMPWPLVMDWPAT